MKKSLLKYFIALSIILVLFTCKETTSPETPNNTTTVSSTTTSSTSSNTDYIPQNQDLKILASWMTGDFDNYNQYVADNRFYVIALRMKRIWKTYNEEDAVWLYVEQAYSEKDPDYTQDVIYRQRVYKLTAGTNAGEFISTMYKFTVKANEALVVKAWQQENPLSEYTINDFTELSGCEVILNKNISGTGFTFEGGTTGANCSTTYPGAAYATTIVSLTHNSMNSLDRMYDSNNVQVGGSTIGGYQFDLLTNFDSELD